LASKIKDIRAAVGTVRRSLKTAAARPISRFTNTRIELFSMDAVDWKKKHLESVRAMECEERQWRGVEQVLRRMVARLCILGLGGDPSLDAQLQRISLAARRNADAAELQALFDALTEAALSHETAVAATGAVPAVKASSASMREAVAVLLDRLAIVAPQAPELAGLRAELGLAEDSAALAALITSVADSVAAHGSRIARDRAAMAATLDHVTQRLKEIALYLTDAGEERERGHQDVDSLNVHVMAQMTRLTDEVRSTDDLAVLRTRVAERLEAVVANMVEFREREQKRFQEHAGRSARLRSRIAELENESLELHRSLDVEKRRSRIDPLTGVANRIAFDERFAQELSRWKRFHNPVSMLIWDIDHFKTINDLCGHRAGDAVLQQVAACLGANRRDIDFFARFGGEEFVSLLIGTSLADALRAAQQMRCAVAALRFHFHGTPVRVTVSCGLTELREGDGTEAVFDRADAALYRAKHGGRNSCIAV
jgi:diguanylate cyclase